MVEYFEIGHISNTHGLKGEVKVRPFTAKMKDYEKLKNILIDFNGNLKEYTIESVRYQKDVVLLKLKGIDIIEDAEKIKGKYIKIPREFAKELEEDEYFIADLIGCEVYQDELIGVVEDIFTAGASDVYVIKRKNKKDLLLPALADVIKKVDVENKKIYVEVPRGLEDDEV
jgi:16S rRNA processing protein RimM